MNIAKLKGKLVENGMTQRMFAKKLGMTIGTIVRRLDRNNGGKTFTVDELKRVIDVLNLTDGEIIDIFFDSMSHKCDR